MPIFGGMIMTPRSMRSARTTGNLKETSKQNIQQSRSDPMNLRRINTDDSSVFSGLASVHQENSAEDDENQMVRRGRLVQLEILPPNEGKVTGLSSPSSRSSGTGKHMPKSLGIVESLSDDEDELDDFRALTKAKARGSDLAHGRSVLRNLQPVTDWDSAFTEDNESSLRHQQGGLTIEFSCNQDASAFFNNDASTFCQNDASTISYGSVNEFQRPRGKIRLLSNIQLLRSIESSPSIHFDDDSSSDSSPPTPDGAEAISRILKDFGDELDENIMNLTKDDNTSEKGSSIWEDIVPGRVKSYEEHNEFTGRDSRQLQMALHQAQSEVDVLRDNNEQFISELEQTEEEHESEMKLYDERIKQKMFELKEMYREEIDALIREKDAAIAEAGLQAAQHAEAGRKQIASLQKEIETLKLQTKQTVKKAISDVKKKKDEVWSAQLATVRAAYEMKLETWRRETDAKLQGAVNDAVAKVTKNLIEERNRQRNPPINEDEAEALQVENAQLLEKQNAVVLALKAVKDDLITTYAEDLEDFPGKSKEISLSDSEDAESLLHDVVELFCFLLEQTKSTLNATEQEVSAEQIKKVRNEIYMQVRNDLTMKHRAELEHTRKQLSEMKAKVERLQNDVNTITKEKKVLQEDLQTKEENHSQEMLRLQEALASLEKSQRWERSFHNRRRTSGKPCTPTSGGQNVNDRPTEHSASCNAPPLQSPSSGNLLRSSTVQSVGNVESRDDLERSKNPSDKAPDTEVTHASDQAQDAKVTHEEPEETQRRERSFHSVRERRRLRDASGQNNTPTSGQSIADKNTSLSTPPIKIPTNAKLLPLSVQTGGKNDSRDDVERFKNQNERAQKVTPVEQEDSQRRERSFHSVRERRRMLESSGKHNAATSGQDKDNPTKDHTRPLCAPAVDATANVTLPPSLSVETDGNNKSRDDVERLRNLTDSEEDVCQGSRKNFEESPSGRDDHNDTTKDHENISDKQNGPQAILIIRNEDFVEDQNASPHDSEEYIEHPSVRESTEKSGVQREKGPIKTRMDALGTKDAGRKSPSRKKSFGLLRSLRANKSDSTPATFGQAATSSYEHTQVANEVDRKTEARQVSAHKTRTVGRIRNFLDVTVKNDHEKAP